MTAEATSTKCRACSAVLALNNRGARFCPHCDRACNIPRELCTRCNALHSKDVATP